MVKTYKKSYTTIELFAWAWWLALWMEKSWFHHLLLNDINKYAADTLKLNRKNWNVLCKDISDINFYTYNWKVDLLTWWFPCQTFSYAWNRMWFNDVRWTMFFQYARAVKEIEPKVLLFENVKWLVSHDKWKTLTSIIQVLEGLWYFIFDYKILNALNYWVPQKRQRIIVVWIKKEYKNKFSYLYPSELKYKFNLKDALKSWKLYKHDVPLSDWQKYPPAKKTVLWMIPPWGCWRDLPLKIQKEYMKKSFYLWWGKTWIARRISWSEPSLTLTCSPAQKQTERCHPDEVRPFTVREYARIQTFPDDWIFSGSISQQYKQIWNAVPVNLSYHLWISLKKLLDDIYDADI